MTARSTGLPVAARSVRPILGAVALAGVAALALLGPSELRLDRRMSRSVQRLLPGRAVRVSAAIAAAPHQAIATGAVAGGAVVLLARGRQRQAGWLVLAAALAATAAVALKRLLRRPRPGAQARGTQRSRGGRWGPVDDSGGFPSGHTTSAAIAALAVSRALAGAGGLRAAGTLTAAAGALVVGASRVHLAEHSVSDVLAGYGIVLAAALALPHGGAARR